MLSFYLGVRGASSDSPIVFHGVDFTDFATGTAFFVSAWAAYGVYRTVLAARTLPDAKDVL